MCIRDNRKGMPRTQIATPDLTALFSGGVAPPSFELRENRCETTDMADDRAPYVQSSGVQAYRSPGASDRGDGDDLQKAGIAGDDELCKPLRRLPLQRPYEFTVATPNTKPAAKRAAKPVTEPAVRSPHSNQPCSQDTCPCPEVPAVWRPPSA